MWSPDSENTSPATPSAAGMNRQRHRTPATSSIPAQTEDSKIVWPRSGSLKIKPRIGRIIATGINTPRTHVGICR